MDITEQQLQQVRYHGIFKKLQALPQLELIDCSEDMYGIEFSQFFELFSQDYIGDVVFYQQQLQHAGILHGTVLDLACGSGRLSLPLARLGHQVDGLDNSASMLELARQNLRKETDNLQQRLHFALADMTSFNLNKTYDLIVLGCTSLSLLLASSQRKALFHRVRQHLKADGCFMFDLLNQQQAEQQDLWFKETASGQELAIVGHGYYPELGLFTFNIYRESIDWNGDTQRYIGSSTKALLTRPQLEAELAIAGLQLLSCTAEGMVDVYRIGVQEAA